MLAQRTWTNAEATRDMLGGARADDLLLAGAALEARLGVVRPDVALGHEDEAGVGVGRLRETARQLVQEELHHREEALRVRLLVDREVQAALADPLDRPGQQVVAARVHAFARQTVLLHDLGNAL